MNCLSCVFQATGEKYFHQVRVGQLPLYSQVLFPPPWRPSHASAGALHVLHSHSHGSEVCRVLTTTDVGNATQG